MTILLWICCQTVDIAFVSPAVGGEINHLLNKWSDKRDKLSQNFKDLFDKLSVVESVGKRKRGRHTRSKNMAQTQVISVSDWIRNFAAEEMIELYLKVIYQTKT